jgi:beta-glucosidase
LPEAPTLVAASTDINRYVDAGRAISPFRLVLYSNGITVSADTASAALPNKSLQLAESANAASAMWTGSAIATLAAIGPKLNLVRETDADMALTLTLSVDQKPAGLVSLAVGCGPQCRGSVDVTRAVREAYGKGKTTIAVRLACFRGPGADMRTIDTPLQLSSSGALRIRLYSAAILPGQGNPSCPGSPAS